MCGRLKFKVHYWPALTTFWFAATFIISYVVAICNGNVYYFFPFISDTGAAPPESCVFGQMLNIGAVLMGITMYIRYRQTKLIIELGEIDLSHRWNKAATWCGVLACFGMSLVANFQETAVPVMHFLGAVFAFFIGSIYFVLQTRISYACRALYYKHKSIGVSRYMFYWRLFMALALLPLFFANSICSSIAYSQFDGDSITWWTEENAGFQIRLAATTTEWILAIFMILYIVSFTKEFRSLGFERVAFVSKFDENQQSANITVQQRL